MPECNIYLEDIPLDEVQAKLMLALEQAGKASPLAGEEIPLSHALGRITAAAVWAKLSSPHYHSAAMDGYAVQAEDTLHATETRPIILQVGRQAFAINTGDPLPPDTNAVIKIEDVQLLGADKFEIRASIAPRQHVRLTGEDMVVSELVLPANHKIRPVDLGAMAGCGYSMVLVRRQPRTQIIPTGSELVPVTQTPQPGQIIEYNSLVLAGQIQESGGLANVTDIVPDTPDKIRAALEQAIEQQPELILVLSGSSAGSKDFTASIIREMGQLLVHGVAVRPGHPVIIGLIENIPVIGVPGYPVSAALTGEIFIQPLLAHWLGQRSAMSTCTQTQAIMTRKLLSPIGDDDFVRVTLAQVGERLLASPLNRGAGVITSLVKADGLAHIPRFSEGADMGQLVDVLLYRPIHEIQETILAMGSHDPMLDLLAEFLATYYPGYRLTSANVGSIGGLAALRRQEAHFAGVHLLDPQTGAYNIPYLTKYLPNEAVTLVNFAHREQGFIVAAGNPHHIHGVADLTRVRFVNRQRGAGTRLLLDYELRQQDISPESIVGYDHEEVTHLAVAAAVASGVADCGMGVRSAAFAMGLDFIPFGWEQYDLVIPNTYQSHPGIQNMLLALRDPRFHQLLGEQPGYDTHQTGQVVFP